MISMTDKSVNQPTERQEAMSTEAETWVWPTTVSDTVTNPVPADPALIEEIMRPKLYAEAKPDTPDGQYACHFVDCGRTFPTPHGRNMHERLHIKPRAKRGMGARSGERNRAKAKAELRAEPRPAPVERLSPQERQHREAEEIFDRVARVTKILFPEIDYKAIIEIARWQEATIEMLLRK